MLDEDAKTPWPMPPSSRRRQRVEHYEMAAYGTLIAWAKIMDRQRHCRPVADFFVWASCVE